MKRWMLGIFIGMLVCSLAGCAEVVRSPQEIEKAYEDLNEDAKESKLSEEELAGEYAKLFREIEKADKAKASDYATLLRKITHSECDFTDEEVFEVAESYATVFEKMAEGYHDFGLQDIVVKKENAEKYSIGFEYCGNVRAYSVECYEDNKTVKVSFYDAKYSKAFLDKYTLDDTYVINGIAFKLEYAADHGFCVYISGASVINVEEKETTTVNRPGGMIMVELFVQ